MPKNTPINLKGHFMNKKTKPVSGSSTRKTAAKSPSVPDAIATPVPETPSSDTTVAMRITRPASDYVPPSGSTDSERSSERKPVRVHDLTGYVVFALPPHLKEVLGDEAFARCVSDLEAHVVTAIHREIDAIVYIRMQCISQLYEVPTQAKSPQAEGSAQPQSSQET